MITITNFDDKKKLSMVTRANDRIIAYEYSLEPVDDGISALKLLLGGDDFGISLNDGSCESLPRFAALILNLDPKFPGNTRLKDRAGSDLALINYKLYFDAEKYSNMLELLIHPSSYVIKVEKTK